MESDFPVLIQGGMGVAVSGWRLAHAVSERGHLGVVSGTALDTVLVRRLQDGDDGGHMRRALAAFPVAETAETVLRRFYRAGGRAPGERYRHVPMLTHRARVPAQDLCVLACFAEVYLAREGHGGPVGMNLLTKVQPPTLPSLYGAMLAGVDCILMGAGIPREIPGALDRMARGEPAALKLDLIAPPGHAIPEITFDPARFGATVRRPAFFAIVASHVLATVLARKASGRVDGFVVEAPVAGGHNAPPRGAMTLDPTGQPVYGERDTVDWAALRALGVPFWVAGGVDSPERVREALSIGASGVQVGTLFAFCADSGMEVTTRRHVLDGVRRGDLTVFTDVRASSTGYPFKVVPLAGSAADPAVYARRERICDLGYLREAYVKENGTIGHRCAAEPVDEYVAKGGDVADTIGRKCLCNGLMATVGYGQVRETGVENPLVTSGDALASVKRVLGDAADYSAADVIDHLLAPVVPALHR